MPQRTVWPPERVSELYEQAALALWQAAELAEDDAIGEGAAGTGVAVQGEQTPANRARRAAERARQNALRLRVRSAAERLLDQAAADRTLDRRSWWRADVQTARGVAAIGTDLAGTVLLWNTEAERLYGWRAGEVLGRLITDLTVGPEDGEVAEQIMASVRRTGCWEGDFWVRRRDGTRFLALVRDVMLLDADRCPLGIAGFSVELSRSPSLQHRPESGDLEQPRQRWGTRRY